MLFSFIPIINFWASFRIQRLEMAISLLFPILIGLIVLLGVMPNYPFFPLSYVDRFNLFLILFGGALVFFIRRWSIKWNEQINKGQIPNGDNIDKKVRMVTQLVLSVIPFLNFAAFARIYYFQRSYNWDTDISFNGVCYKRNYSKQLIAFLSYLFDFNINSFYCIYVSMDHQIQFREIQQMV